MKWLAVVLAVAVFPFGRTGSCLAQDGPDGAGNTAPVQSATPAPTDVRTSLGRATSITFVLKPRAKVGDERQSMPVHVVTLDRPSEVAPVISALTASWVEPAHVPLGSATVELSVSAGAKVLALGRVVFLPREDGAHSVYLLLEGPGAARTVEVSDRLAWLVLAAIDGRTSHSPCPRCGARALVVPLALEPHDEALARRVRGGELLASKRFAAGWGCKGCGEAWPHERPEGKR